MIDKGIIIAFFLRMLFLFFFSRFIFESEPENVLFFYFFFFRYEGSLRDQRMGAKSSQGGGRDADVVPSSAKSGRIATNGPSSLGAHADTFTYVDASRRGETGVGAGAHGAGGKQSPRSLVRQHASPSTWERSLRNGGHSSPVVDGGARLKQGGKVM